MGAQGIDNALLVLTFFPIEKYRKTVRTALFAKFRNIKIPNMFQNTFFSPRQIETTINSANDFRSFV